MSSKIIDTDVRRRRQRWEKKTLKEKGEKGEMNTHVNTVADILI